VTGVNLVRGFESPPLRWIVGPKSKEPIKDPCAPPIPFVDFLRKGGRMQGNGICRFDPLHVHDPKTGTETCRRWARLHRQLAVVLWPLRGTVAQRCPASDRPRVHLVRARSAPRGP